MVLRSLWLPHDPALRHSSGVVGTTAAGRPPTAMGFLYRVHWGTGSLLAPRVGLPPEGTSSSPSSTCMLTPWAPQHPLPSPSHSSLAAFDTSSSLHTSALWRQLCLLCRRSLPFSAIWSVSRRQVLFLCMNQKRCLLGTHQSFRLNHCWAWCRKRCLFLPSRCSSKSGCPSE